MLKLWPSFILAGALLLGGCTPSETSTDDASGTQVADGSSVGEPSETQKEESGGRFGKVGDVYEFGTGYGSTAGEAINSAMSIIIMKINGAEVEVGQNSDSATARLEGTVEDGDAKEALNIPLGFEPEKNLKEVNAALNTAGFQNQVSVRSRGTVSRVEVLNLYPPKQSKKKGDAEEDDGTSGLWRAEIKAATLKYTPPESSKLPRVSIHTAESDKSSFAVGDGTISLADLSADITQAMQEGIKKSGYFTVLSRDHYHAISEELTLIASGLTEQSSKERPGNLLASDIAIIPVIKALDYGKKSRSAGASGKSLEWYNGKIEIEFFAMNVVTREVIATETYSKTFPSTQPTTLNRGFNGRPAVEAAIQEFTQQFLNDFLNVAAPLAVMRVNGDNVVISGGEDRVSANDRFTAFLLGEEIIDPRTDTSLGFEDTEIGTITIDRVTKQLSYGELTKTASVDLSNFEPGKLILQPVRGTVVAPEGKPATRPVDDSKPSKATQAAPAAATPAPPPKPSSQASSPAELPKPSASEDKDDDW
ncbi:MAG: CsgG/HfaB family protein [Hyphomonas sp.]